LEALAVKTVSRRPIQKGRDHLWHAAARQGDVAGPRYDEVARAWQRPGDVVAPGRRRHRIIGPGEDQHWPGRRDGLVIIRRYDPFRPEVARLHARLEHHGSEKAVLRFARDFVGGDTGYVLCTNHRQKHAVAHRTFWQILREGEREEAPKIAGGGIGQKL